MRRLALLAAAIFLAPSVGAQIYQWKDESGKTVISDKPPVGQVPKQKTVTSGTQAQNNPAQKSLADRELDFRKRQKPAQESSEKTQKDESSATEKREICDSARRQLQALESGERIALRDDKGERYYMEDSQREQETTKMRNTIEANCK